MKIGAKQTFLFGLLLSSSASLMMGVTYFLNRGALFLAVVLRVLIGLGHGPLFPATFRVWAMWASPVERSTLTSIGFCSSNLGTGNEHTRFLFPYEDYDVLYIHSGDYVLWWSSLSLCYVGMGLHICSHWLFWFHMASVMAMVSH